MPKQEKVLREGPREPAPERHERSAKNGVFIGTSGWSYPTWKPDFYPQALPQKEFLKHYAARLNSVEVNYTFNRLPTQKMLANWLASSHDEFRFSFKAPQRITHRLRLRNCSEWMHVFCRALAPVASARRMGLMLFQLPPNFKADVPRLQGFLLEANPHQVRMAFEFRHNSWFCDEVYTLLQQHGAALCVAESEDLVTPEVVTAPFACYRFRKEVYAAGQLRTIEKKLRRRSEESEVFAYFRHQERPTGALYAVEVRQRLQTLR